ncbi:MAG: cation diffusion facilitator family transporter [Patescibacteria group bacterium]|nr:cation diffusion facilitator family transporter [Patescibacteria group bacterium]
MSGHSNHLINAKNLVLAIIINSFIVIFEIIFGVISRSFALISDALHNITDIGSMILSLWGEKLADKPQTEKKTYGYNRAELIIAFVNAGVLLGIVGFILVEAIIRFFHPEQVASFTMLIVAGVALVGNGIATYLLQKGADKNLNLKSAWLHSMQDALFSLAVVIGAVIIYYTGWNWIDPLASIIISVFLLKEIYSIIKQSVNMLMDSVPEGIDFAEVKKELMKLEGISDINDLHIWQTNSENKILSVHIKISELSEKKRTELLIKVQKLLKEKYGIDHSTLQMVSEKEAKLINLNCNHCN